MSSLYLLAVGLVPLLGATQTLVQGCLFGLYAVCLTALHQALLAPLRRRLNSGACRLASLVLLAALSSCLQLALAAWSLPLTMALGHWPVLFAVQCLLVEHLFARARGWRPLALYLGSLLGTSLLLGACRQWLGQFVGMQLAGLAPGALILLGLFLGLYNRTKASIARPSREGKP